MSAISVAYPSRPTIAVIPHRLLPGVNSIERRGDEVVFWGNPDPDDASGKPRMLGEEVMIPVVSLRDAFGRRWDSDAHLVLYLVEPRQDGENTVRLNKPAYKNLIEQHSSVVVVYYVAADYDTKDHAPWTVDEWNDFLALLKSFEGTPVGARLAQCCASFPTRKGWRFVWRLSCGVSAPEAEPLIRGFLSELTRGGLRLDQAETLRTWNCAHRLPNVLREGVYSEADPFFFPPQVFEDRVLDVATIVPEGKPDLAQSGVEISGGMPDEKQAWDLLHFHDKKGRESDTQFFKDAKEDLHGKDFWRFVFEPTALDDVPIAPGKSSRHDTIAGWIASAAYPVMTCGGTVQHLFALFYSIAQQLAQVEPNRDRRGWIVEVWRLCEWAWKQDWSKFEEKKKQEEQQQKATEIKQREREQIAIVGIEPLIRGVRLWHLNLPTDPIEERRWVNSRMILKEKRRGNYWVMRLDGTYPSEPVDETGLLSQICMQKMDAFIPIEKETKSGSRPMKAADLAVAGFMTNVSSVEAHPEISGGYIANPEDSERPHLVVLSFRRNPVLTPQFSPEVDLWMRALSGEKDYEAFCRHTACLVAWDRGPVAAVSLMLAPGAGKGMYMQGLIETLENYKQHFAATADDLVQKFNDKLRRTPFIFLNEGMLEGGIAQQHHPSDMFRRVVTGDLFQAEGKGRDAVSFKFSFRVVLTANHWRLIDMLGDGRDLSPHERDAIGIRLVHYSNPDKEAASRLLAQKGGRAWTKGWVEDDLGRSDFVVARHFLWLYEKYGKNAVPTGTGRLLVEGSPHQEAIQRLRVQGGSTPVLIETLLKMLDSPGMLPKGLRVEECRLYVTVGSILDYWRGSLAKGTHEKLTAKRVALALAGLVIGDVRKFATQAKGGKVDPTEWHEIDVPTLAAQASKYGWSCSRLDAILEQRLSLVMGTPIAATNGHAHVNGHANGNGHALAPVTFPSPFGAFPQFPNIGGAS